MKSLRSLFLFGLAVLPVLATPAIASAHDYGSFVLRNPASVPIHYQVRWGNGDWKSWTVQPGHSTYHYYPLSATGQVPAPSVRFDWIAGDGQTTYQTYSVQVYATTQPSRGKPYVFRYSPSGRYLYLYAE